ncbi:DsbA family protein [Sulfurospirillum arcachonense]|uniref:DsbA family protein n=1 Tax=Sulfurospirillum arcachonense TaxID=57666 RepID=UPI00046A5F0F|nr:thioredoxin domain-containing protein [Sulfurospirillum arcachonense]
MSKQKIVIFTAISLILLFMVGGYVYKNQQSAQFSSIAQKNSEAFVREHSLTIGNKDAKVHIVEFFDPACETCADFYPFIKDIMKKNEGNIKLTLRYAPFHQGSDHVVKMLEAARKQGKFHETLEMIFATQSSWASHHKPNPELLWKYLAKLGLDIDKLVLDMKDPALDTLIAQDLADAKTLGATKTPSYFVNTKPLEKFGYKPLKELIYSEL